MVVARCAHADCGRFVKADETWCAKHKTDAVFDIVRSAAEGAKADDGPLCGDPTCEGPACRQEAIVGWNEQRAADARALFHGDEQLPHHADMVPDVAPVGGWPVKLPRAFGSDMVTSPQAQVFHGLDYIHRTYDQSEPMAYSDAANELARGKHRVKDKPNKRRWWQRKDTR